MIEPDNTGRYREHITMHCKRAGVVMKLTPPWSTLMDQQLAKFVAKYLEEDQTGQNPMQNFMLKLILKALAILANSVEKHSGQNHL